MVTRYFALNYNFQTKGHAPGSNIAWSVQVKKADTLRWK